jgi:hypothetical protein
MSTVLNEVLNANKQYSASFGDKTNLALPPASPLRGAHLYGCPA